MAIRCCTSDNACYNCPLCNADVDDCNDKQRQAADLIETLMAELEQVKRERESPKPLTLEELREMDGEPVWIVEEPNWGHWELSANAKDYLEDREEAFYGMKHDDPQGRYGLHVLGWLAFRRRPVESLISPRAAEELKWMINRQVCGSADSADGPDAE